MSDLGAGAAAIAPFALELENISHAYSKTSAALATIDLSVRRGEIIALLGPSGCGKTTLLNIVAGLLRPTSGRLRIDGVVAADAGKKTFLPPERRGLGMVFQDYALWPHLTIGGNVAFPLEMLRRPRAERRERVAAALERVGLAGYEDRSPATLSGGQQQRAALARAIVGEPALVLFDEPLSNLDRELRESLAHDVAGLMRKLGLTALYVTHDQSEAFAIASRIAIMRKGRIVQDSSPEDLIKAPADADVAAFLDLGVIAPVDRVHDEWRLRGTDLSLRPQVDTKTMTSARILIPRNAVALAEPDGRTLTGIVLRSAFRPEGYLSSIRLDADGADMTIAVSSKDKPSVGERVGLALDADALHWFPTVE